MNQKLEGATQIFIRIKDDANVFSAVANCLAHQSLNIQDARIYTSLLDGGHQILMPAVKQRSHYLQIAKGKVAINNIELNAGDAVKIDDEADLEIDAESDAALLWFDLPKI
jgi:redox-sensitive bicupin YhaK (pirin superfamily)